MDPKNLPNLDPKLKEAYERVMSTSFAASTAEPTPVTSAPPQVVEPPSVTTAPPNKPAHHATTTFVAGNAVTKEKKGISPVILLFAGVVFFVVYALFWTRFFNLKLPF